MHRLLSLLLIFLIAPSFRCQYNLTYVLSPINTSTVELYLQSNGFILTNSSYVKRLSTLGVEFLNSTEILLAADDIQSIAVSWNTGDCSFPAALAAKYDPTSVSNALCFTGISLSFANLLQLTITIDQLADSAAVLMHFYSLTYFSVITSLSNDFYFNLAQEFSTYLTRDTFVLEQFIFLGGFTSSSVSARSRGQSFLSANLHITLLFSVLHRLFVQWRDRSLHPNRHLCEINKHHFYIPPLVAPFC